MNPPILRVADIIILVIYLAIMLVAGFLASRRIHGSEEYFLGRRRFSKWIMIAQSFGTGTHAEMPVSLAGAVYSFGLSGIWFQWKSLFVTPFYWLLAPLFRRFRRTTMSEVFADRYGSAMSAVYTIFALVFFTINLASMLKGAGKVIDQSLGGDVSVNGLVLGMTVVFSIYSFAGGLVATAWTDLVQGLLILTLSFMLIPLGWHDVGGWHGLKHTLGPDRFALATPGGVGVFSIVVLTLNGLIGIVAQPHMIASVGTGRDERSCRIGQFYGNFIKRLCTVGWAVVGLMTAALLARHYFDTSTLKDPEEAFGYACRHLLFPGGIGLLIAALLAANMAACSSFMVNSGALITNGIYRKFINPEANDRRCLLVGRFGGLVVVAGSLIYAVWFIDRVLYSFLLTESMATFVGISVVGGIIWHRANRWGAIASIVVGIATDLIGNGICGKRLDDWNPLIFLFALIAGSVALVVVSLATHAEPTAKTREFHERLQTPSDDRPMPVHEAAAKGRLLLVVNLLHPRRAASEVPLLTAYREDLKGFAIGVGLIGALVSLFAILIQF